MISPLEARHYADPEIFAAEQLKIFRQSWQIIGSETSLATAGSYRTIEIGGVGLFVIRGSDGVLRAFKNVCRHRGSRLLDEDQGSCAAITCPYHAWRYDDCGKLNATPWFDEHTPFDLEKWPLFKASVTVWRGLVFVSIEPGAALTAQLGELPGQIADIALEGMTELATQTFRAPVNWKAYLDQFTEYYHVPAVHAPDKGIGLDRYSALPFERGICMAAPPDTAFYGGRWYWSWPNWTLAPFLGGAKISRVMPISAQEAEIRFIFLFDGTTPEASRQRIIDATASIFAEDVKACMRAQRNYASGEYRPGPMHPRHEQATAYFQHCVRDALEG